MLRREVDDDLLVRLREGVLPDDERVGMLPDCAREGGPEVLGLSHVEQLRLEAEGTGRRLDLFPGRRESRAAHVQEGRDPGGFRNHLPEQLDPFRVDLGDDGAHPGDVPAGSGEARDDALPTGSASPVMTTGMVRGRMLGRQGRLRPSRHDQVDLQSDELRGQARESLVAAVGRAVLDHEVLPLDVPEIAQPLPEGVEVGRIDRRRRSLEHADPVELSRRLGLESKGPGEQAEGDAGDEGATIHQRRAITRSAKSSITRYCRLSGG